MNKRQYGKTIENVVEQYLRKHNYEILERNFTIRGGEIDIISIDRGTYVFVEVKSLKDETYLKLEQTISATKKRVLTRASQIWLQRNHLENKNWRIDFVGVITKNGKVRKFLHIENAVY